MGSLWGCTSPDEEPSGSLDLPERAAEPLWQPDDTRGLFDFVTALAAERARTAWRPPPSPVGGTAAESLTYDRYREIRFRGDSAFWGGERPFEIRLDHPGGGVDTPVRVHLVSSDTARRVDFDPALYSYGGGFEADEFELDPEAGFAGFRVLHPMNRPDHWDEVVSFRGASYFRMLGPGQVYGISARGVAVGVAGPEPEEFPDFVEFWISRPEPDDTTLILHALLDGPSITGAYRFELTPGRSSEVAGEDGRATRTRMRVRARLFARQRVAALGIAPLTSMYLHGTFDLGGESDIRPRVHDSEALLMETHAGEVIWRPLTNPDRIRVTALLDRDPRGFGLAQPTRGFDDFLDLEALYHRRPGLWVEPSAGWGPGAVRLVELPTDSEFADNIVSYWAPADTLEAGERGHWAWTLETFDERPQATLAQGRGGAGLARVVRTRIGSVTLPGAADPAPAHHRRVVVDFEGGALDEPDRGAENDHEIVAIPFSSTGSIRDLRIEPLPSGGRRVSWILEGEPGVPADMRVHLRSDRILSESWSHLLDLPPVEGR